MSAPPSRPRRTLGLWFSCIAVGVALLCVAAVVAWVWLPRWQPSWVIAHSPWLDPLLRAEAAFRPSHSPSWKFQQRLSSDFGAAALPGLRRYALSHDAALRLTAIQGIGALLMNIPAPLYDPWGTADPSSRPHITIDEPIRSLLRDCATNDANATIRNVALSVLLLHSSNTDESALLMHAIVDPDSNMRAQAAEAMARHPHDSQIPALIRTTTDTHWNVRLAAVETLGTRGGEPSDDALMRALDDSTRQVSTTAAYLLLRNTTLSPERRHAVLMRLITALHDDGVRGNACGALTALSYLHEADVQTALSDVLTNPDRQARQFAAHLLRECSVQATPALVTVSIEALASDGFPWSPKDGYTPVANASSSLLWLVAHPSADDAVIAALSLATDIQQRFCCAFILALHRRSDLVTIIAPVLIPHLQDNHIQRDAAWAMRGLFVLGRDVEPWLERALPHADKQGAQLIALILKNLRHPPANEAAARRDSPVWRLFELAQDPSFLDTYEKRLWVLGEDRWSTR